MQFFFDFLSPYSYFAWLSHEKFFNEWPNIEVQYKPVLMGRLFSYHQFPGPGEIIPKRNYELKKCFRYAYKNNIPFNPPHQFPFNPMAIIRMGTVAAAGTKQKEIISKIFSLVWGQGQVLEDPEFIQKLFEKSEICSKLSRECIEKSFTRQSKAELKENIKMALELNIFGVPSFAIENEFFWGNDSFEDLSDYLAGNDKFNQKLYNKLIN